MKALLIIVVAHNLSSCEIKGSRQRSVRDQLSVDLMAQLVEHYTGITVVMGLNPVQAFFFFFRL